MIPILHFILKFVISSPFHRHFHFTFSHDFNLVATTRPLNPRSVYPPRYPILFPACAAAIFYIPFPNHYPFRSIHDTATPCHHLGIPGRPATNPSSLSSPPALRFYVFHSDACAFIHTLQFSFSFNPRPFLFYIRLVLLSEGNVLDIGSIAHRLPEPQHRPIPSLRLKHILSTSRPDTIPTLSKILSRQRNLHLLDARFCDLFGPRVCGP